MTAFEFLIPQLVVVIRGAFAQSQSGNSHGNCLASAKQLLSQNSCGIGFQPVNSGMTG